MPPHHWRQPVVAGDHRYYKRETALPQDALGYINITSDVMVEDNEGKSFFIHTPYRIYSAIADSPEVHPTLCFSPAT